LKLWSFANYISDVRVAKRSEIVSAGTDAQILAVVAGQLEKVEESRLSITLGIELHVELVDEGESGTHDLGLLR